MSKRILYVEDDPEARELLSAVLDDCDLVVAESVADAVEHIRSQTFHTIILDYYLPDGNGVELCNRIRMFDRETPIMFVTSASRYYRDEVLPECGAAQVVDKAAADYIDQIIRFVDRDRPSSVKS